MALTITATITLAAEETYSPLEARIVAAMQAHPAGGETPAAAPAPATEEPAAAEPVAEEKPKRAPRTRKTPAADSAASTTPAVLDTTLDETPAAAEEPAAEEADDLLGTGEPEAKEYTTQDAVNVATPLLKAGKQAEVKAALDKAGGVKRVSELKGSAAIETFIKALED